MKLALLLVIFAVAFSTAAILLKPADTKESGSRATASVPETDSEAAARPAAPAGDFELGPNGGDAPTRRKAKASQGWSPRVSALTTAITTGDDDRQKAARYLRNFVRNQIAKLAFSCVPKSALQNDAAIVVEATTRAVDDTLVLDGAAILKVEKGSVPPVASLCFKESFARLGSIPMFADVLREVGDGLPSTDTFLIEMTPDSCNAGDGAAGVQSR